MEKGYLEVIGLIERLHRQFLEVVKAELDSLNIKDINNVQSLILYNIASEEVTVGELTYRGYYLGSNVSYNLKKMVETGYLEQERSTHDRRTVRVRLSEKGKALHVKLAEMFAATASGTSLWNLLVSRFILSNDFDRFFSNSSFIRSISESVTTFSESNFLE